MVRLSQKLTGLENGKLKRNEVPVFAITGRLGRSAGCGFYTAGAARCGESQTHTGIYQKRVTGYNNYGVNANLPRRSYYVRMRTYAPTNPRTAAQQLQRSKMADAVAIWKTLTDAEKAVYTRRVKRRGTDAYRLFISEYLKNH